ncbi:MULTISPECIES: AsnC family transcriptional regulator [Natrialba]|uniref:AsnC family transcriptional regulator n=1 Tax=Natrialba swarupiae TaxID=2448032 RepID=A0A5D5ASS7_9EURY|nr:MULTISPECIES: AsnC family transcriptional regulator [Natrialba]MWV38432.1 AsnC family transcriptional regulator [Natrialba sp. INN-245]TYT62570.1 AsnC family transcriptional regulator [Natrialba swarupiae]
MPQELDGLDEIDRTILRILVQNPRTPYSDIAEQLEDEGFEMSGEGIRYRVSKLFETTSILLLTAPKQHGWEVIRLFIAVEDNEDAKEETFEALAEMGFWMNCRGLGSFDLYAVATVSSNRDADDLIDTVRTLENVSNVEYMVETDRMTTIENYLAQ